MFLVNEISNSLSQNGTSRICGWKVQILKLSIHSFPSLVGDLMHFNHLDYVSQFFNPFELISTNVSKPSEN